MSSSTSSSDPAAPGAALGAAPGAWRRFVRTTLAAGLGAALALYAFVVTVDPWDCLPLSPPLPRVPISTNARFTFPALARSPRFDSAVFGTSTSRLLRPAALDPLFGARFANLAMNSATAYEQTRLLQVFARAHPQARTVLIGLDATWCEVGATFQALTPRAFPEWMYGADRWRAYPKMLGLYPLQEAASQFAIMVGLKRRRYGLDGYTRFTPPEDQYDAARAHAHIVAEGPIPSLGGNGVPPAALVFPAHALLREALDALPAGTRKLLFFVPYHVSSQGQPGTPAAQEWPECKRRVAAIAAAVPNAVVADFMFPSAITRPETNYWDPKHYRMPVADRLARDLALAARGEAVPDESRILTPELQSWAR